MKTLSVLALLLLACRVSADTPVDALEESDSLAKLRADMTALQSLTQGKQVAFSASLVTSGEQIIGPVNQPTPLIFKHVVTNIGNAYSPITGAFTAPLKGAYHFQWHIYGRGGAVTRRCVGEELKNIFLAYGVQPSYAASATQGATLLLEAGDIVFVRQLAESTVYDNMNHHTSFSGHLLFTM